MAKPQISMSGRCINCGRTTEWYVSEGWVFHTQTKHWRCSECRCATQPHLFLPPGLVEKIERQTKPAKRRKAEASDDIVIEL